MSTAQASVTTTPETTIPQLFSRNAKEFSDVPALTDTAGDRTRSWTWAQAHAQVATLAAGLATLGLRAGQTMLVMMPNRVEHWLADLAATQLGAVPSALYTTSSSDEVLAIARHSRARVAVLHTAEHVRRCSAALRHLTSLEHIVVLDQAAIPAEDSRCLSWEALCRHGEHKLREDPSIVERHSRAITPSRPVAVLYTAEIASEPKGVVLTHRNVGHAVAALHELAEAPPHIPLISHLPLAHIAERMTSIYAAIHKAAHVHFYPSPATATITAALPKVRPRMFFALPRLWEKLAADLHQLPVEQRANTKVQRRIRARIGLDRTTWPSTGTAPLSTDVLGFFASLGIDIMQTWGLTETTGCVTTNHPAGPRRGTVGRAVPGAEIKTTEDGEVLVRGPIVCAGYLQSDGVIRPATDADGWLHTGAIGNIDEDGFLSVDGRRTELITGPCGSNIAPSTVESALKAHPLIGHALAFGDQRPYLVALLVLDEDTAPSWARRRHIEFGTLADLARNPAVQSEVDKAISVANAQLDHTARIHRYRLLSRPWGTEGGELTPTFKLRRQVIQHRYADVLDALYE